MSSFTELLKIRRQSMTPAERKRTRNKKYPNWLFPVIAQREYKNKLSNIVIFNDIFYNKIEQFLNKWVNNDSSNDEMLIIDLDNINIDMRIDELITEINNDSLTDDLQDLIDEFGDEFADIIGDDPKNGKIPDIIYFVAAMVLSLNEKQWFKQSNAILGFDYITSNGWWKDVQDIWSAENFALIKNLPEQYLKDLQVTILNGVKNELSATEILNRAKRLEDKYNNRLKLIVRDQIGKLNGQITKFRMREVGIEYYIWDTSLDERVRGNPGGRFPNAVPNHWIMHGYIFDWNNNYIYAVPAVNLVWLSRTNDMSFSIPGDDIQCRCTAIPYWKDILENIDYEIDEDLAA